MDLLQNQYGNSANDIQSRILDILHDIGISPNNMKKAEEFFDFSKELNLDIIKDSVEFQYLNKCSYEINRKSYKFLQDIDEKDFEYSDRYILFLDAVGYNTIYNLISSDFTRYYNVEYQKINFQLTHALSHKYNSDEIKGKGIALIAEDTLKLESFLEDLEDMATENPNVLLKAGRYYCKGEYINSELKLYALALAYISPIEDSFTSEQKEDITFAVNRIINMAISSDFQSNNIFDFTQSELHFAFVMIICFMTMEHSESIKNFIINKISGKEMDFLNVILEYMPKLYFESNPDRLDKLLDLIDFETSSLMVYDCIKTIIPEYDYDNYVSESRKDLFLAVMAKKYPKQYVDAMRSTEAIKHSRFCSSSIAVCNYYKKMYTILEKANPQIIKDYGIDFNDDILKLTIITEQENSQNYKNDIGAYLSGESDISVLEPYFDKLADDCEIGCKNEKLINDCLEINPQFTKRYIAFKSIQHKYTERNLLIYSSSVMFDANLNDMYTRECLKTLKI